MHLGSMKDFCQASKSEGSELMDGKTSLTRQAQESLAPFGTCLRVGIFTVRMESREGRANTVVGGLEEGQTVDGKG